MLTYIHRITGPDTPAPPVAPQDKDGARPRKGHWLPSMSPMIRKITHAVSFETLGILLGAAVLRLFSGAPAESTLALSTIGAVIALGWSYLFNTLFEAWEAHQTTRGRSFRRRATHALLFEGGMTAILLPVTAWMLSTTLLMALIYEAGLILFYLAYAWAFTWAFDRLFGLPQSAR